MLSLEKWDTVRRIFDEAVRAEPSDRPDLVRRLAGSDDELQQQVMLLLTHDAEESPLDQPLSLSTMAALVNPPASGTQLPEVAPYRILDSLGRGGMGVVYLAERADGGINRTVALKLVHPHLSGDLVARRLRAERDILAGLEHPGIARLYDAGTASDNRPFLVMEYVQGERIDRHCDNHRLGIPDRLRLFGQVCDAVEYAHRALVVHRDLKPSNMLVDADGRVRLLDFGVASVLRSDPSADPATAGERSWLTLEYASPEQIRGEPLTAGSDVYSLGVVLHELIVGERPFTAAAAMRHFADRNADPPVLLSRRIQGWGPEEKTVAARARALTGPRLEAAVRGDLDTIVAKALDPDPARRYPDVGALSEDVRRHLNHRPIRARPPSLRYRAHRFVQRNSGGVALAGLLALSATVGAISTVRQGQAAQRERARAESVAAFLSDLFQSSDPRQGAVRDSTLMIEFVDQAYERTIAAQLDEPVKAELLETLAGVYRNLSRLDRAVPALEASVEAWREVDPDGPGRLAANHRLGLWLVESGRAEEGFALLTETVSRLEQSASDSKELAEALEDLGQAHLTVQANEEAVAPLTRALGIRERSADAAARATVLSTLGAAHGQAGRAMEALPFLERAVALGDSLPRPLSPAQEADLAVRASNLAATYAEVGRAGEAETQQRQALATIEQLYPPEHEFVGLAQVKLGDILAAQMRDAPERDLQSDIDSLYQAGLAVLTPLSPAQTGIVIWRTNYARYLEGWGQHDAAAAQARQAVDVAEQIYGADYPLTQVPRALLGRSLMGSGRLAEADATTGEAYDRMAAAVGPEQPLRADIAAARIRVLITLGRFDEAQALADLHTAGVASLFEGHPLRTLIESWAQGDFETP